MTTISDKTYYRPSEIAKYLDVSDYTVRKWMRLGKIQHVHFSGVIRIHRNELTRILQEGIVKKQHGAT